MKILGWPRDEPESEPIGDPTLSEHGRTKQRIEMRRRRDQALRDGIGGDDIRADMSHQRHFWMKWIGMLVIFVLIAWTLGWVVIEVGEPGGDDNYPAECQDQGGTVLLDEHNVYEGCIIP